MLNTTPETRLREAVTPVVMLGTALVAKIGNSVPPELAEAVVRANYGQEREVEAA